MMLAWLELRLCLQGSVGAAVGTDPTEGQDLARKERKRIMELAQSRGMQRGSYPQFDVAVKGQKVVLVLPPICLASVEKSSHFGSHFREIELSANHK